MLFTAFGRIKEYIAFPFAVIFFASVFILCPIKHYAEEKPVKEKITTDSQNKQSGNTGENNNKTTAAENSLYDYERPTVEEESYVWLFFKTLIVLAMLVGGFYYFYRFVTKKTGIQSVGREVIRILSIVPVGQNKFLQVVDLAGRIMVIGVSDSNINLITEIKDKDEIDRIRILSSKSSPVQPGGFQEYVSKYVSRLFKKDAGINEFSDKENIEAFNRETETDRLDFLKKQRERLKKINGKNDEL
ncbi:MAG: flagellar biosynthetic protein FliO [Spirochaetota bacterium]